MYLNCKTWFSLCYGTFPTEKLVEEAKEYGVQATALTNINTTAHAWDFVDFCQQRDIKPVLGTEIRNRESFCYILLAKNNQGFYRINKFLSEHLQAKKDFPAKPDLGEQLYVIYPFGVYEPSELNENELIGVQTIEIHKLFLKHTRAFPDKYVVRQPVTFADKQGRNLHRLLRAIDNNILLSKQDHSTLAGEHERFFSPVELMQWFSAYPAIITNSNKILDYCSIDMKFHTDKTKKMFSSSLAADRDFLRKLALTGMKKRYGKNDLEAIARVNKELKIIDNLGFNAYFLITRDILRYANDQGFFYVGRGSGANSIVAYCLEITDVNPIELDLYFERFLNPYRKTPPDFDIDFSWKDRDEIIDYIFKRFGQDHVCLLGAYTTFQDRAIIRELGKVLGLPPREIDSLESPGADFTKDKNHRLIRQYAGLMKDFPHHLSIHAGGILISELPIHYYSATEMPPKGFATCQVDMFVAEKIGLFKLDVLSQRGLGHIKEAVEIIQKNRGISVDIRATEAFKADPKIAAQIRSADTIGCFYIESPAMRQLLKKLRCSDYLTLVAASSIIRPGVSQSGMMKEYIWRFHHPGEFKYLHPKMEELLAETYGVMVYQEDVIKIAHHFGGLDMGEADVLRRAMSGKYRGHRHFELIRKKYFKNCLDFVYSVELAEEVWRQIESFGGYSFSKAHSASFAVESYQSLFLKTYYPREFMVAVINNFGGFYKTEIYFEELKKAGAVVDAPCVNQSDYLTSIRDRLVHVGLVHIDGIEQKLAEKIIN